MLKVERKIEEIFDDGGAAIRYGQWVCVVTWQGDAEWAWWPQERINDEGLGEELPA